MTDILLTGFAPFDAAVSNPSWDVVNAIAESWTGTPTLAIARLPVSFLDAGPSLLSAISAHQPSLVIATGVASGRATITPERVAINVVDARIPDNDGEAPTNGEVVPGGAVAYWSTLPIKAMTQAMNTGTAIASVSNTAGTYVCNAVFYALQHATAGTGIRSGFIHVPATEDFEPHVDLPRVTLRTQVEALRTAIDVAWHAVPEPDVATGTTH